MSVHKTTKPTHGPQPHQFRDQRKMPPNHGKKVPVNYKCIRCGEMSKHFAHECWALEKSCRSCGRKGHIAKVCRAKSSINNASDETCSEAGSTGRGAAANKCAHVPPAPTNRTCTCSHTCDTIKEDEFYHFLG